VRRLSFIIMAVACTDVALLFAALMVRGDWTWMALQLVGLTAVPLALGALIVLATGSVTTHLRQQRQEGRRSETLETPYEIVVARGAARLLNRAARTREGKAALRAAGRLVDVLQSAAREPPPQDKP
jgi:hypothetical protein